MQTRRQFELVKPSGQTLMTWLPTDDTRAVGVGSIISLADTPGERWEVRWRSKTTVPESMFQRRRFTNSAVRDENGSWVL